MPTQFDRPAAMFVGESPALDFLNSVATPKATLIDWIDSEANLLDWLEKSGLCQKEELAGLDDEVQADALAKTVQDIREFRDDFRAFVHANAGRGEVSDAELMIAKINAILSSGTLQMQIETPLQDRATRAFVLATQFEIHKPRDLLTRIAAACAKLICEADFRYIKNCEGPACTMYFLDVSKNHKRRWCSMSVCGNRAKAAAHRRAKAAS